MVKFPATKREDKLLFYEMSVDRGEFSKTSPKTRTTRILHIARIKSEIRLNRTHAGASRCNVIVLFSIFHTERENVAVNVA